MQPGWKNKLENWQPEPPPSVWDRISEQLPEAPQPLYAQKLQQYSATPPERAWEAISGQLQPTPVVRMLLPRPKWVRLASVAASLLFAVVLFRWYNPAGDPGLRPARPALQQQSVLPVPVPSLSSTIAAPVPPARQTTESVRSSAATFAVRSPQVPTNPLPLARTEKAVSPRMHEVIATAWHLDDAHTERYMVIAVAEGAAIRLPRKIYDLFRCGELPISADCSQLLTQMRQQTASPSLLTPTDFAGILEIIKEAQ